jgi:uncharacterized protein (DUF1015 family)
MAEIRPFRALHYNPAKVGELSKVITQPYDKISPEMQEAYYGRSPYNLVRIIRAKKAEQDSPPADMYSGAARNFKHWIETRILTSESEPALYPYYQEYGLPDQGSVRKERRGFIGLCRLEDYAARVVHRHEETLSGPKADRMELLKRTRAHFGQVFFLYSDPEGTVEAALASETQSKPWEELRDEYDSRHCVWRVTDPTLIERVVLAMRGKKLIIADGHHRYETALAYRNLRRAESGDTERAEYVMATFIRMETDGLTILPTHRVVCGLPAFDWSAFKAEGQNIFEWQEIPPSPALSNDGAELRKILAQEGGKRPALAAYAGKGKLAVLLLRQEFDLARALPDLSETERRLDVIILHRLLIERALGIDPHAVREERNLRYVRSLSDAVGEVDSGRAEICFLLNATPIEAVRDIAFAGQVMPQKSTDFFPKLLSGLTIYWLDNPSGM